MRKRKFFSIHVSDEVRHKLERIARESGRSFTAEIAVRLEHSLATAERIETTQTIVATKRRR